MSIAFSYHNDVLTVVVKGRPYNIKSDDPRFAQVKLALKNNDEDELEASLNAKMVVENYLSKNTAASLINGRVYINGKEVNNCIAERVKEFAKNGLPFQHLLLFIENISKNPSYHAQQELFNFLEHKYLPITEDGCFYAYKSVRDDWTDVHSGQYSNRIGNVLSMPRGEVDDNRNKGCSKGFHCGSIDYVNTFGPHNKRMIIVKVNPMDVVCVPDDCSCQKVRVCKYECHSEYVKPLDKPLYGNTIDYGKSNQYDDVDWDDLDDVQVTVTTTNQPCNTLYTNANYKTFYNKRDDKGRFCK